MPWKHKPAAPPPAKTSPEPGRAEPHREVDLQLLRRLVLRAPLVFKALPIGERVALHGAR